MPSTSALDILGENAFAPADAPRRILVYAPMAYSTPHYETDLEIAQRHLDAGDAVELVLCQGELPSCQLNPVHEPRRCVQCISRSLQGAAQLSPKCPVVELPTWLTPEDRMQIAALPKEFPDHLSLRAYTVEGFDAGMATLSSVIDFTRSLQVDTARHARLIHHTLVAAVMNFLALKRLLAARNYDRLYIYNGRWSMMRCAVRACEQAGVDFYTHERGSDCHKFTLYANTLPHNKENLRNRVQVSWDRAADDPQRLQQATAFFEDRRRGVEKKWFSHTKQQQAGRLPDDWNRSARRIVYFTSSEFESAAIGDQAKDRIYRGQIAALPRIATLGHAADATSHIWVRVHPNDKTNNDRWAAAATGHRNVTLIPSTAEIDSYALLDGADRVLTFGSTMGIEATYWGKAAICAEHSFYNGLGAQHEATTEAELIELLTRPELPSCARENALRYGYYLNTHGENFRHFETDKISDYEFKSPFRGRCLKPDFEDLRKQIAALFHDHSYRRAAAIAQVSTDFDPTDVMMHTIRVLSLLRLDACAAAIQAAENATEKLAPSSLEPFLRNTGKALVDGCQKLCKDATADEFQDATRRTAQLLRRVTAFASVADKLMALSGRVARAA